MKPKLFTLLFFASSFIYAEPSPQIVKEIYETKYLGPTSYEDWLKRGSNGKMLQTFSDGSTKIQSFALGKLHGPTTITFPHSTTAKETLIFDTGCLVQKITYFTSGQKEVEIDYLQGKICKISSWFFDGTPKEIQELNDGLIQKAQSFKNGQIDGQVIDFQGVLVVKDAYGNLLSKDTIAGGELAQKEEFYPNGELRQLTPYFHGKIHGQLKTFQIGGIPLAVEEWKNGCLEGNSLYFENGQLCQIVSYKEGKKHGIEKHLKDNKKIAQTISWKNGKKHGVSVAYIQDAPQESWYLEDKKVSEFTYNIFG